jgi:hypothetical protein
MVKSALSFFLDSGGAVAVTQNTVPAPATACAQITDEERRRRMAIVSFAEANVGLEGFPPADARERALTLRYVNGEIDMAEFTRESIANAKRGG